MRTVIVWWDIFNSTSMFIRRRDIE